MLLVKYNLVPLSLNLCFHLGLSLSQQAHFAMTNAVAALDVPYVDFLFFLCASIFVKLSSFSFNPTQVY